MRETLEDLYYGNITPYDRQIRSGTSLMKAMEQSQECEGEAHRTAGWRSSTVCCCGSSTRRTRSAARWLWRILSWASVWGARLILEALDEDDGSLVELLGRDDRRGARMTTNQLPIPPVPLLRQ